MSDKIQSERFRQSYLGQPVYEITKHKNDEIKKKKCKWFLAVSWVLTLRRFFFATVAWCLLMWEHCDLVLYKKNWPDHFLSSHHSSLSGVKELCRAISKLAGVLMIKSWFCVCVSSPVTQVVSAVISCLSQSSPPTAACGLSSAAAVTGWEKDSPPFMRVSTHSATSLNSIPARRSADWTHGQSHNQQCA